MESKKLAPYQIRILELLGTEARCVAYGDFGAEVWPDPHGHKMRTGMSKQGLGMRVSVALKKLRKQGYVAWLKDCREGRGDVYSVTAAGLEALQEAKQNG